MALQRQNVSIPLGVGVDNKTDSKQVPIGKVSVLENGVFKKIKSVKKRFGLSPLVSTIISGGAIASAKQISSLQQELIVADGENLYAYSPNATKWVDRGALYGATVQSFGVSRDVLNKNYADSATANGFLIIAWGVYDSGVSPTAGVYASIIDTTTNQPVLSNVELSSLGKGPRCSSANGKFYVHYRDGAYIKVRTISSTAPSSFTAEADVAVDFDSTDSTFDICPSGSSLVIAYAQEPGGIRVGFLDSDGLIAAVPAPVTHADDPNSIAVISYSNGDAVNDGIYVVYWTGGDFKALIYDITLSNSPAPITIGASSGSVLSIALAQTTSSTIAMFATIDGSIPVASSIEKASITRAGVASAVSYYIRNLWAYSKPVMIDGVVHLIAHYPSTIQAGYFILAGESDPKIINRISYQNAGVAAPITGGSLSTLVSIGSGQYAFANVVKTSLTSEDGEAFSNTGIQFSKINFSDSTIWQVSELGRQKYVAAGMLSQYDGQSVVETGFNVYPEYVNLSAGGAGAVITAGTRQYIVVYEWINLNGDIERSAPSIAETITNGAGVLSISVTAPYLNLTQKDNVQVCIYRTIDAGTTFYKVGTQTNDPSLLVFTFVDESPDSDITSHELLYTTGGTVDNIPPPSCTSIIEYNDRLIAVGLEDSNAVWFSKQYQIGTLAAFNDSFVMRIDRGRSGVTAAGVLDDKLVLFKSNQLFITVGNGPLATGAQNDFQTPINDATDVGCSYPRSVVQTPLGLMFKSLKGYYLLDRSLQVSYIGSAVEDYNSLNVTSAVLLESSNEVRFTHSDGVCLVYNYLINEWSVLTNYLSVGACNWSGTYTVVRSSGLVEKEDTSSYLDNGVAVSTHMTTSWIQMAGIEGFQRIYELILQGTKESNHTITVKVGYDFSATWSETFVFDMSAISGSLEELKIKPAKQKCTAIRFDIADSNPSLVNGAGVSLTAITLVVGVKGGTQRVPASRVMVAS